MFTLERQLSLSITLLAGLSSSIDAQSRATSALVFSGATFTATSGAQTSVDTATLTVPQNRRTKSRGTITIPVVRFAATSAALRARSPIIYISGGSGSGIAASRGSRFDFFQSLRELGDVITFDLRGAGASKPSVSCPDAGSLPVSTPVSYESLTAIMKQKASDCATLLRSAGVDLTGHNIAEIVEDIEALRIGLGAPTIRLVGISTGTQIGLEYLRRHGKHVERAVLAGVQGPNQQLHSPADQELVVRTLAKGLTESGKFSGNLVAMLRAVFDSLEARPRTVMVAQRGRPDSIAVALGKFDAQLLVSAVLGDRPSMPAVPAIFGAAMKGDFRPMASMKVAVSRTGISAFELLSDCQTGAPPRRMRALVEEAQTALLGRATLDFPEACAGWGVPEIDASYRAAVRSARPVLLISGTLDGRTPVRNAEEVKAGLSNAVHKIVDGASHGDDLFLFSPDLTRDILSFLRGP